MKTIINLFKYLLLVILVAAIFAAGMVLNMNLPTMIILLIVFIIFVYISFFEIRQFARDFHVKFRDWEFYNDHTGRTPPKDSKESKTTLPYQSPNEYTFGRALSTLYFVDSYEERSSRNGVDEGSFERFAAEINRARQINKFDRSSEHYAKMRKYYLRAITADLVQSLPAISKYSQDAIIEILSGYPGNRDGLRQLQEEAISDGADRVKALSAFSKVERQLNQIN